MMRLQTTVPVVVFQVTPSMLGHGGLGIARSAGRIGVSVFDLYATPGAPEQRSRYWAGHFPRPEEDAGSAAWLECLAAIGRRLGRSVLIATDDTAAVMIAENGDLLREWFLFPDQPPELVRSLSDKRVMHELCETLSVPTPGAEFPESREEVERIAARGPFPVVAKRIAGWHPARGPDAKNVVIAQTLRQLLAAYEVMESAEVPNVMLQEYIPGGSDSIWMFNGYFDGSSQCLLGSTGRKLRQRGPHTGPTTLGECVSNPEVDAATRRLMADVGYSGILDIGYRHDRRDDSYKLLDVNPRIGETFRLFASREGLDVLRALYLDLTGQSVPASTRSEKRRWVVEPFDAVSAAKLWREQALRPAAWARSFRRVEEFAWLARDDPRPFAAMVLRSALEATRRVRPGAGGD